MPKARSLIDNAPYDPALVKAMGDAFDAAWASIAENYEGVFAIEGARIMLANIVLNFVDAGERDPERLKDRTLRTFSMTNL